MTSRYLTRTEVLLIHARQLEQFGGAQSIRDPGQLESAIFRPQTGYYEDVFQEAAALWESLSQNHPFADGNKRTSFAAADTFLLMNGWVIEVDQDEAYGFIIGLYEMGRFCFEELDAWIRLKATPLQKDSP